MKRSTSKKTKAMNNIIPYLVQSAVTLMALYTVYWLFLRKDTFFHVNRFYLLLTLLFSLIIPFFDIRLFPDSPVSSMFILLDPVIITPEKLEKVSSAHLSWIEIAGVIYLTGVAIFTLRLMIQLIQLVMIVRRNDITRQEGMNIVFVDRGYSPFSFFNLVFIRKEYYFDGKLTPVLSHEQVHIRQYHTLDLLVMEIVTIVQWFNPFVWFLGRSLKGIHEFLADEGVLKKGFLKSDYQSLILNEAMGLQVNNLTNNFNVSLIKKRIIMMTKSRSGRWAVSKLLITLPAILCLGLFFSAGSPGTVFAQDQKKEEPKSLGGSQGISNPQAQDNKTKTATPASTDKVAYKEPVFKVVEKMPMYPGGDDARIAFMIQNLKYPEQAKKNGIQGKVFVTFVVEVDGSITEVKVLRGIGGGCDEEAVRVIKLMPKWSPGMQEGKAVRVQFNLPIKFALNTKSDTDKDKAADKDQEKK
jgi:TonB family protein